MEQEAFEAEIALQIAKAKYLACQFRNSISPVHLERLEKEIRAAFACAIAEVVVPLDENQRVDLIKGRLRWKDAKKISPYLNPIDHIRQVYPDRKEIGMLRRDLKNRNVDPKLYQALSDWLRPKKDGSKNDVPSDLYLPTRIEATDIALKELAESDRSLVESLSPADARLARAVNAQHSRSFRSRSSFKNQTHRLAAE